MTIRHLWRSALLSALLACVLVLPSAAPADNIPTAPTTTVGVASLTIPADGHQVYRVRLSANDWVIGYAWTPGTSDPAATISVFDPAASDVASSAVSTSTVAGVLSYRAPAAGTYSIDFAAAGGTRVSRGLFLSRPSLSPLRDSVVVVPYNGTFTASCVLRDPRYTYVPYDGPAIAFENVVLSVSRDGTAPKPLWAGSTDLSGRASRRITGITSTLRLAFSYPGAVYDSAAFGSADSGTVTVVPRVALTVSAPKRAKRNRPFRVSGTLRPAVPAGPQSAVIEVRKRGRRAVLAFPAVASAPKRGASVLAGPVSVQSAGTWYARLHRPAGSGYAETVTKWVEVHVR